VINLAGTLRRWRWLVAAVVVATAGVAMVIVPRGSDRFVSTATYVVQANAADEDDRLRATTNLSDAPQIGATFAYVSESEFVLDRALDRADAADQDSSAIEVAASAVGGANILRISVTAPARGLSRDLAEAVGAETIDFIDGLDDLYDMSALDPATEPARADSSRSFIALGVGALAGAGLGLLAAIVAERIRRRRLGQLPTAAGPGMRDEGYTARRLSEEISRTNDTGVPFLFTVMKVMTGRRRRSRRPDDNDIGAPSPSDLPRIERAVARTLREHDHLGQLDGIAPGTFAAILPGLGDEEAIRLDQQWTAIATKSMARRYGDGVRVSVLSCCYGSDEFTGDPDAQNIFAELL
jgi:hypothetical protein